MHAHGCEIEISHRNGILGPNLYTEYNKQIAQLCDAINSFLIEAALPILILQLESLCSDGPGLSPSCVFLWYDVSSITGGEKWPRLSLQVWVDITKRK